MAGLGFMADAGPHSSGGMLVEDSVAPSVADLRPLVPAAPGKFPVYPDLQQVFLTPTTPLLGGMTHPDRLIARSLAVCSGYAYSDAATVSTMMARMGLTGNRCRMIAMTVDAMFIVSSAFVVQSEDGRVVVLAYRGTEPINLVNWLTDADLTPRRVRVPIAPIGDEAADQPLLHGGFYRNVRATRYKVVEALRRAANGVPVTVGEGDPETASLEKMEALYITGHSLGAAMASIHAMLLKITPEHDAQFGKQFKAAYTFAQPMVGNESLAAACNEDAVLERDILRFVFRKDPVPHLPPKDIGRYANFGREFGFDGSRWAESKGSSQAAQARSIVELVSSGVLSLASVLPALRHVPVPYVLDDHAPQHYIEALTLPGELTEFGDYQYA